VLKREMDKSNKEQAAVEHEKLRNSMIRKANDDLLRDLVDSRANAEKTLSGDELNQIQADIDANKQNLQSLYYENTRN
jgi:hypothetical protein